MIRWFFLCWLWQLPLQAQYILDAQQVALITYTDENDINTSYHFYKQTGRDAFVEMYLNLGVLPPEKKGDEFLQISWKYDSRVLSLKQIKKEGGLLLYPKDLPMSSYTDFLGKMYGNYASSDKIRGIFHLLNPFQVLRYIVEYDQRRYFHGDNIAYADDDHPLWRARRVSAFGGCAYKLLCFAPSSQATILTHRRKENPPAQNNVLSITSGGIV